MSTINYARQGSGEPVVLIHGIGQSGRAWESVPALLGENYDVISIDLPGHGQSPKPGAGHGWSVTSQAAQLEELFEHLGLDRPHVIGNSLGGAIALELATRGKVRSATAVAPAGFYSPLGLASVGPILLMLKGLSYAPRPVTKVISRFALGRKAVMWPLYVNPERLTPEAFLHDAANIRSCSGFAAHFVRLAFFRFTKTPVVPTSVLWGDRDRILLPTQSRVARKRLPRATHVTLQGAGHCPQLDVPGLVVKHSVATFERAAVPAI